ncbi:transmembrane protein 131-like isoform X2 [Brachyhypopomus gauderio]|uniref:transmembrane protein 131-like isoform X2 n=1 Tax=Brachyhypopomus gauderio TaxID=698409 RepID=UPI0040413B37
MAGRRDFQRGSHCHRKTWINVLGVLHLVLHFIQHGGAQFEALTEMSSVVEVWQAEDAEFLVQSQALEEQQSESVPQEDSSSFYVRDSRRPIRLQPSVLDFGTQPVGLPRAETVYIHNPSVDLPVTLQSIFTTSTHFHMPSIHRRVIPPRGKTSFKLIFLPTEEGNVENSLFINTSTHGVMTYQVFGVGIFTPDSITDKQERASVLIIPHIQSIKLTQTQEDTLNITILGLLLDFRLPESFHTHPQGSCFEAEKDGHLSLQISLSERGEKPAHLDKLKPYVLENIMVLLVLLPQDGTVADPRIRVYMVNTGARQLFVKEVRVLSRTDSSVEIHQTALKASSSNLTQVATLSCRGSLSSRSKKCSSQIGLEMQGNRSVNMFSWLDIAHSASDSSEWFQFRQKKGEEHVDVWMSNPLPLTFTITNVSVSQPSHRLFKVMNIAETVGVAYGCWRLLTLQVLNRTLPVNVITIVTLNTSLGLSLELRLRTTESKGGVVLEAGGECEKPCPLHLSQTGHLEWQRSLLPESFSALWRVDSSLASTLCSHRHCSKPLSCRWPRLPAESSAPLDFGATPVNESKVKNFTLRNPTGSVVSVEIRTLSSYPAPLEALDLLTKWFSISPLSVNITTTEFSLLAADRKERQRGGGRVQRVVLQPWEWKSVSVAYTPTEHKPVTSVLLIRNNLTVFDLVLVTGFGAKELLRVGGKLPGPGASLRFNVPQSTLMECRDGLRSHANKPLFAIQKSFKVENAGELPLTVMSMNINGYKCQGFGFEVLRCKSFSVDYNSSDEITIAFTPDFTSSWVIRDLTLVTERGSAFPFTLNVTLPHHMLPLCAQVVPGPSWEESFWVITLVFTCFSLAGVCLMAFHQAQYILRDFSTPVPRNNHNPAPRENGSANHNAASSASRGKGSCKNYSDTCHTSDKGKGRGSTAVANGTARPQTTSKKSSGGSSQPLKKQTHKVSFLYSRYKYISTAVASTAANTNPPTPPPDEQTEKHVLEQDPDICNNNNHHDDAVVMSEAAIHAEKTEQCREPSREGQTSGTMFPMETLPGFPESITANQVPQPVDEEANHCIQKKEEDKEEMRVAERERDVTERKRPEKDSEMGVCSSRPKPKKNSGKNRRRAVECVPGLPENSAVVLTESDRDPESRGAHAITRTHNHTITTKPDTPKMAPVVKGPAKPNGMCLARPRRKGPERRPQCESGSDSGSSSGSVRASRGSWGSWSSASSMEGEKEPIRVHGSNTTRKSETRSRDVPQYSTYPTERDCCSIRSQSLSSAYVPNLCQSAEAHTPPTIPAGFADMAAGLDRTSGERSTDASTAYVPDETWSARSVPLTNDFRYSMPEPSFVPQSCAPGPFSGNFPWNNATNPCNNAYSYSNPNNYVLAGNGNYPNTFSCPETQTMPSGQQSVWNEEVPEAASSWDMTSCVVSKPFFPGTRSLSPISSSLFGSIWTPQSDPYRRHLPPERSAPASPHSPATPVSPVSPFSRQPGGTCPAKQYSTFNPFGPHMNLDIWNSSSNRSSTSQLSNDSGYSGDV